MPIPQLKRGSTDNWRDQKITKPTRPLKRRFDRRQIVKKLLLLGAGMTVFILILAIIYIAWITRDLPNPNQLINRDVAQSTKILDRSGETVLYEISGSEKRTLVSLEDIPDHVKWATISIEDKNFYEHGGFSVWAMFRTMVTNIVFRRSAGGSTLTQQFIKNAVLTPEKTLPRKIKEMVLAYRLEKKFSKDEILQMYLNEIPYGSNAYGVEAASQKYFGKSVRDISLPEAAVLAAIVQAPSRYSPWGANKDVLLGRKDYVLDLMAEQGYISSEERDQAKSQEIIFKGPETNIIAPHFVMYIKDLLAEKYGEKMIEQDGLKIYTTIDAYKQKIAEEVITEITKDYPEKYKANNAALVSIDPKTGQILAMVGSRNYFDDEIDGQVNVALRPRQPGSSIKPLVYAALFEKGYTPNTILYDVLTNFSNNPDDPYEPKNYSNTVNGPVTIRKALAGSLNIPAVKAMYLAGTDSVISLAENLGYSTLSDRERYGLSLVLGGGEVKLLEHVNAYSAFARDGQMSQITGILKVEDKNGRVIEEFQPTEKKVLSSQVARMINEILSDNAARTYAFGANNPLTLPNRPVAAKTGTTNNYRDGWTIGYTPSLVTGVWVGNNDNSEMKAAGGSIGAAPIWQQYMKRVLGDTPAESFKSPDDYKTGKPVLDGEIPEEVVKIDTSTGELADETTPPELIGEVKRQVHHNILFYVNPSDPLGDQPQNPESDPQYLLWEDGVSKWAKKNATSSPVTKTGGDEKNKPAIIISLPVNNEVIASNSLDVYVEGGAPRGIARTEYYINDNFWLEKTGHPERFTAILPPLNNGYHTLKARSCDDQENCGDNTINFNLLIENNEVNQEKPVVEILNPSNNQTISRSAWPISIELQITNPSALSRVKIYAKNQTGNLLSLYDEGNLNNKISIPWNESPPKGEYAVYTEASAWSGGPIPSSSVVINVE